ncbi:hypothetical protein H6G36_25510 [Anabaena minutissima FACHB-250]|nr:hypothetical protein [Anabaena minutissima FACHB-250]
MSDKPILFSAPMIRAILEGRKTQTRRIIKPQPELCHGCQSCEFRCDHFAAPVKQQWQKGDILWVRETWREALSETHECYAYRADNSYQCGKRSPHNCNAIWKPSIFMPKKACRLWLEVTGVRIEQLQGIGEEDAIAEGIEQLSSGYWAGGQHKTKDTPKHLPTPIEGFKDLWQSINGTDSWDLNPWCWVVEFKRVDANARA